MLARAARTLIAFGVIAAALLHVLASAALSLSPDFFTANLVVASQRNVMLALVLGGFGGAVAFGVLMLMREPARSLPALERWVRLWCPIIVAPILVPLLHHDFAPDVETALLLAVFVVALERLMRLSLQAWAERPVPDWGPASASRFVRVVTHPRVVFVTLLVLVVGQTVFLGIWAVWAHQRFATYGYDLGCYDSVFACTLHGRWLASPPMGLSPDWSDLTSNHADLAVFYLLPIYAVMPDAKTLLVLQAIFASGSAIPLYLFARRHVPTLIAFAVAVAWLLYAPMQEAQFYDYHPQYVGAAFVICAIASVEYRRWVLYWVFFALAILAREDVSIGLTSLGLYLALSGHRVRTGVASVVLAATYFVGLRFFVMTNQAFAGMYKNLYAPDAAPGFGSILITLVSNPGFAAKSLLTWEKARYVAQIFAPIAFLPMRRPLLWILMIPGFFITLLSTEYPPLIAISFQYVANWAAYMFPAAVIALGLYGATREAAREGAVSPTRNAEGANRHKQRAAALAMLCASVVATVQWGAYSPRGVIRGGFGDVPFLAPSPADHQRERDLRELMKRVPSTVRLCTSDRVQPHTTALHLENWPASWGLGNCDWILWSDIPGDRGQEQGPIALSTGWELVERRGGLSLARRKPEAAPP